jgi:putative transposase
LRENGILCGKNRIALLMRLHGMYAKTKRRFRVTIQNHHNLPVAENLLKRQFETDKPNKVWLSDITYIWTQEGWLYLSAILDLYTRQVIGWSMDDRLSQDLVLQAFHQAMGRRKTWSGCCVPFRSRQPVCRACLPEYPRPASFFTEHERHRKLL